MKHHISIVPVVLAFLASFCACSKSSEEEFYAHTTQDHDTDTIKGDNYVYHIPVIFHVLYQDASDSCQYVSYSRIQELVAHLNELYKGNVYNYQTYGSSLDMHVVFELAEENEQNQKLAQPGVEYVKWKGTYPIDYNEFMNDQSNKYTGYIWDPNEYVNVMLYPFAVKENSSSVTLGVSVMPFKGAGYPQIEGLSENSRATLSKSNLKFAYCLSLNSNYIYNESNRYTDPANGSEIFLNFITDANATFAHEMGHYLGLHHVFAEKDNKTVETCDDTDYCTDTKSYNRPAYNTWLEQYIKDKSASNGVLYVSDMIKRSNDSGDTWSAVNLMDYEVCMNFQFTEQQRQRVREVLYYCPLIPGPKKQRPDTRSAQPEDDGPLDLPVVIVK